MKNQYRGGDCLKKGGGGWTVCRFKGGLGKKEGGGVFLRGKRGSVDTLMHIMPVDFFLHVGVFISFALCYQLFKLLLDFGFSFFDFLNCFFNIQILHLK